MQEGIDGKTEPVLVKMLYKTNWKWIIAPSPKSSWLSLYLQVWKNSILLSHIFQKYCKKLPSSDFFLSFVPLWALCSILGKYDFPHSGKVNLGLAQWMFFPFHYLLSPFSLAIMSIWFLAPYHSLFLGLFRLKHPSRVPNILEFSLAIATSLLKRHRLTFWAFFYSTRN